MIISESPKLKNRATDNTLSRFRVGAASVQMIQMSGPMTPDDSCQRNRKATDALPDVVVAGEMEVLIEAMTIMKMAVTNELDMITGRRPYLSGKTCPVKMPL